MGKLSENWDWEGDLPQHLLWMTPGFWLLKHHLQFCPLGLQFHPLDLLHLLVAELAKESLSGNESYPEMGCMLGRAVVQEIEWESEQGIG